MNKKNQNYIVINGKTYDARSGLVVKDTTPVARPRVSRSMNDIAPTPVRAVPQKTAAVTAPAAHPAVQRAVGKTIHRKPQRAQTLLRTSVQRPAKPATPIIGERTMAAQARQERAQQATKHNDVQRFAKVNPAAIKPVAEPQQETAHSIALAQLQSQHPALKKAIAENQKELKGSDLKEALIKQRIAEAPESHTEKPARQNQGRLNAFFSKQPRLLTAAVSTLCVLMLVGYVTYLNMPVISMRIAASRAGFAATMPGYKPSGYSLRGPVAYSPGQVNLAYNSNTGGEGFTLTQRQTSWDAQALLDNYVAKQTHDYLTYQEKGLTIYMYNGKAAWVNGGVWYNVSGKAALSSDQILQMATSM